MHRSFKLNIQHLKPFSHFPRQTTGHLQNSFKMLFKLQSYFIQCVKLSIPDLTDQTARQLTKAFAYNELQKMDFKLELFRPSFKIN